MPLSIETRPEVDWSAVTAVYADGGVVRKNPSPIGGTWAFCLVDAAGTRLNAAGGYVTPAEVGLPWVSNNLTEVLVLLLAFEHLPRGWTGRAYTDSRNAIRAFDKAGRVTNHVDGRLEYLPDPIWRRLYVERRRLGRIAWTLLGGHPNRKELAEGRRKDGKPVSEHNVFCDARCGYQAKLLAESLNHAA